MSLTRIVLDFESAFGKHPETGENITLSAMTTEEYVRHPRFKIHGLGVKVNEGPARYYYGAQLFQVLRLLPWGQAFVIAHHSHFDGAILTWRLGIRPAFWGCTLSLFRALFPHESSSLSNMAKVLGLPPKGHELVNFKNLWRLTADDQAILGGYCCNDVEITALALNKMLPLFPVSELRLLDWTVRCFTEPLIQVDRAPLIEAYKLERRTKRRLIAQCAADRDSLASGDKFAAVLLSLGVDPPKKLSPAKVKDGRVDPDAVGDPPLGLLPSFTPPKNTLPEIRAMMKAEKEAYPWAYAFGKSDEVFKLLLTHPDPRVQAVVEARLGVKSTIKETRAKRFYKIGTRGAFPVYLNYYGAHTNRWSGGDKQNAQNLNRVDPGDPTAGALRMSLVAPEGHVILVRDLSQIEARMLVYLAGQTDMVEMFAAGGDPYDFMASKIYGRPVQRKKVAEDQKPGQVGKLTVLGSGYQMGWAKFQESIRVGFMGMEGILFDQTYVDALQVDVEAFRFGRSYRKGCNYLEDEARLMQPLNVSEEDHFRHCAVTKALVDTFRRENPQVVALWRECNEALGAIAAGYSVSVGCHEMVKTDGEGFVLPNGMKIRYAQLHKTSGGEYKYLANARKKEWTKLYGGKATENLVQALSRIVLSDQLLALQTILTHYPLSPGEHLKIVTSTHDELVLVCPERLAEGVMSQTKHIMATAPAWCHDLPLKSSGGYAKSYGDCEK